MKKLMLKIAMSSLFFTLFIANAFALDSTIASLANQAKLHAHWLSFIAKGKTTKAHFKFLKDHKVEMTIVESIPLSGLGSFYALFEDGKIYISLEMLDGVITSIKNQNYGFDENELIEVVAQKTIDLIIHEIRHAITAKELESRMQAMFSLPLLEDEVLSYQDQARAIAEFQNPFFLTDIRTEVLDDMQRELYSSYMDGGCNGYKNYISQWNPVRSIMSPKDDLNKWFNENRKLINSGLARLRERLKIIRALPASERNTELVLEEKKLMKTEVEFLRNLEMLKTSQDLINDEQKYLILHDFYKDKVLEHCGEL